MPSKSLPIAATAEPEAEPVIDNHSYTLSKPVTIGADVFEKLTLDTTKLTGNDFLELSAEYRRRYGSSTFILPAEDKFRLMVLAKINNILYEDIGLIPFNDAVKLSSRMLFALGE